MKTAKFTVKDTFVSKSKDSQKAMIKKNAIRLFASVYQKSQVQK